MQIFIDTNRWFSYFKPGAQIETLVKLKALIKSGKVTLVLPQQTEDEYTRNVGKRREQEIVALRAAHVISMDPIEVEFEEKEKSKYFEKEIKKRTDQAQKDIKSREKTFIDAEKHLDKTEKIIVELFSLSKKIPVTAEIIEKARIRQLRGNPPKKDKNGNNAETDSHGDAINWECLIEAADDEFTIISNDKDYSEPSKNGVTLNRYLVNEWGKYKGTKISIMNSLGELLNKIEPKVIEPSVIVKEKADINPRGAIWGSSINPFLNANSFAAADYVNSGISVANFSNSVLESNSRVFLGSDLIGSAQTYYEPNNKKLKCPKCGHDVAEDFFVLQSFSVIGKKTNYTCTNYLCRTSFSI